MAVSLGIKELNNQYVMGLRRAGFKATPARLALLKLLEKNKDPLTVEDILSKLKSSAPDQATIYRSLKELRGVGLIRQVDFQHGHAHYELASRTDHHHIICENCGKIEDIADCPIVDLEKKINKKNKFSIKHHSLEFFGLCFSCKR